MLLDIFLLLKHVLLSLLSMIYGIVLVNYAATKVIINFSASKQYFFGEIYILQEEPHPFLIESSDADNPRVLK